MYFIVLMISMAWLYLLFNPRCWFFGLYFLRIALQIYNFMRITWQTENEIFGCLSATFIHLYSYLLQYGAIVFWII